MILCDACKGKKVQVGLGNLTIDCPSCRGIGWIDEFIPELKTTLKDVMDNPKRKKRKMSETVLQC